MSILCSKVGAAVVSWKVLEKKHKTFAKTKMFNLQPDRIVLTRQTVCNKKSESHETDFVSGAWTKKSTYIS